MSLKDLNKTQKAAVEAIEGSVLIFAGAGSGKTRVLTHKMHYLIEGGHYKPEEILAVTFTNKAASEMKSRVASMLGQKDLNINIGTFHSICARLLRSEISILGYSRHFAIYDVQDQLDLMKIVLAELNVPKDMLSPNMVRNQISQYKSKMITPKAQARKARNKFDKLVADVYKAYQDKLKENDALDFDDLLLKPLELFDKNPHILTKYQNMWKYILVDEYQDTNRPQYEFLTLLSEQHGQITVVGDDDQSIYGWRGADVTNILNFEKFFPSCRVFTLEKNYRSTQQILEAAISVVGKNVQRAEKQLVAACGEGEPLALIETVDELEEADAIVSALEKEIKLKKRTFNHFAILYRTNAQSRALEDSLRRIGIPYNIVGGIRFYNRKEVKDVIAYLRLLMNLKDTVSLRRILNFPTRGIGVKTINKCVAKAEEDKIELFDVFKTPTEMHIRGKQSDALAKFYTVMMKYHELRHTLSPNELSRSLVEEVGILSHFKNSNDPEDRERYENVIELLNSIDAYCERNKDATLNQFLEEVSLLSDIDHWNDDDNRVTLMTIHSSKGLEFPVVFVAGLDDGLFPLYNALQTEKGIEEERRLFYVALTRAEQRVYLLYATNRRRIGAEVASGLVSRFVKEIPEKYLERLSFSSALTRKVIGGAARKYTRTKLSRTVTAFDDFRVGDKVSHAIFGSGQIMALSGTGENQRVGVVFHDGVKKKLIVKYANLTKV